jgi:hypothetical protein
MRASWSSILPVLIGMLLAIGFFVLHPVYVNVCTTSQDGAAPTCEPHNLLYSAPVLLIEVLTHAEVWTALATIFIALFTFTLGLSTRNLWIATRDTAKRQERDTEILQRAYIAAELGGIRNMTDGQLVGHVLFHNVGHLPATNLRDVVKKIEVQDGAWRPPTIPDTELEDHGVLPIGVRMKKGSAGTIYPGEAANSPIPDKHLYVWGRITYDDGFYRRRYLNFCHRYPCDKKETPSGGGFLISEEHGRYHEHGSEAD